MAELLSDFLSGAQASEQFFRASFLNPQDRRTTVALASQRPLHPAIADVLARQNLRPESSSSLNKLSAPSASVVVTGQQLGICGGPLFTLYKILTAVKLASYLEKECGSPVIPIFWLQSEDHDFEEIRTTSFLSPQRQLIELKLPARSPAYSDCCGNIVLSTEDEARIHSSLRSIFDRSDQHQHLLPLLKAYSAGMTLSQSFAAWIQHLCAPLGVLTLDPNCREVKQYARELIASSFLRYASISRVLSQRAHWLRERSYPVQVPIKENCPLFFLSVRDAVAQRRVRLLAASAEVWEYPGGVLKSDALFKLLDSTPELFSSSALIRPILQDTILPTAAYVSGPVEFNYWVQLTPLYDFFGLVQPLVVPRAHFTVWEAPEAAQMKNCGLTLSSLMGEVAEVIRAKYRGSQFDPERIFSELQSRLSQALDSMRPTAESLDAGNLISALELTKSSILHNVDKFESKWIKSLGYREASMTNAFQRLKQYALPNKQPQERVLNLSQFPLIYGRSFLDAIIQAIDPIHPSGMQELTLQQ